MLFQDELVVAVELVKVRRANRVGRGGLSTYI